MSAVRRIGPQGSQKLSGTRRGAGATRTQLEHLMESQTSKAVVFLSSVQKGRVPALRSGNYEDNPFWIERSPLVGWPPVYRCQHVESPSFPRAPFTGVNVAVYECQHVDSAGSLVFTSVNVLIPGQTSLRPCSGQMSRESCSLFSRLVVSAYAAH